MTIELTRMDFVETVHTPFQLQLTSAQTIEMELIEVHEGYSSPHQEQFALLFRGPLAEPFGQGTWPVEHEKLGCFELFLVPVRRDTQGMYYEAVFNRLLTH